MQVVLRTKRRAAKQLPVFEAAPPACEMVRRVGVSTCYHQMSSMPICDAFTGYRGVHRCTHATCQQPGMLLTCVVSDRTGLPVRGLSRRRDYAVNAWSGKGWHLNCGEVHEPHVCCVILDVNVRLASPEAF